MAPTAPGRSAFLPHFFQLPSTPDLGCLVRRQHGFELDSHFPFWSTVSPTDEHGHAAHQAYLRVKCGKAAFHQRVKAWMRDFDGDVFSGTHPDWVLGGDFPPHPSDWVRFPPQAVSRTYWLRGEHRNPSQASWQTDAAVGHSFDLYDHGTLSTVGWDDAGGDLDFDDMIIEVAMVHRQAYFDSLEPVVAHELEFDTFVREELPKLQAGDAPRRAADERAAR